PKSPVRISSANGTDKARIIIEDFGPGISREKQDVIFERFERAGASANIGGLGLGLFITRRIVEAHQGTIRVESEPGKGSQFIIELPLRPSPSHLEIASGEDVGIGQ